VSGSTAAAIAAANLGEKRDPCVDVLTRNVWIGAQKKSSYVIRLSVGDVRDVCFVPFGTGDDSDVTQSVVYSQRTKHNRRLYATAADSDTILQPTSAVAAAGTSGAGASGAAAAGPASSAASNSLGSLSALVLPGQTPDLLFGEKGINTRSQEWVRCCERSTEFHFASIPQQMSEAVHALQAIAARYVL
jgi:hypothetical protein